MLRLTCLRRRLRFALALWLAAGAGCSSSNNPQTTGAQTTGAQASSGAGGACGQSGSATSSGAGGGKGFGTIFTIVFENHDYAEIVGSPNAPFFNSLIAQYGLATNYQDSGVHPSLPNYLTMVSGAPQYQGGIDLPPTLNPFPVDQPNLGNQLETACIAWRAYNESAQSSCELTNAGDYAPKHDPFLYFTDVQHGPRDECNHRNATGAGFAPDLAAGNYRYMWYTPNLTDDGHNPDSDPVGALKTSDAWAKDFVGKIMASAAYQNGGVIFITWDEAEGRNGDDPEKIPMIIASPRIVSAGFKSDKPYSHKSYLATVEDMLGLPRLDTVKTEPSMLEFFK